MSEKETITRSFAAEITRGDGRTVDVRVVPYNTVATVSDAPEHRPYREAWMPGVFDPQMDAPHRVLANFEHQPGLGGVVGHGTALRDDSIGPRASFRIHDNVDGDKLLHLIGEGVVGGVSLEAVPLKSRTNPETGVVERIRAHLDKVSFVRFPAFKDAEILAVREQPIVPELVPPFPDEMLSRLEALGIKVGSR